MSKSFYSFPSLIAVISVLMIAACQQSNGRKKVFFIYSQTQDYNEFSLIQEAFQQHLRAGTEVEYTFLAAGITPEKDLDAQVKELLVKIKDYNPAVLVACDDEAIRKVIVPHFKNKDLPVIFCGLDFDAGRYGFPGGNVTGVVERFGLQQALDSLKKLENQPFENLYIANETQRNPGEFEEDLYRYLLQLNYKVETNIAYHFDAWRYSLAESMQRFDAILIPDATHLEQWDQQEAKGILQEIMVKPTFSFSESMKELVVLFVSHSRAEQGKLAAEMVNAILEGNTPEALKVQYNQDFDLQVNKEWLELWKSRAGVQPS